MFAADRMSDFGLALVANVVADLTAAGLDPPDRQIFSHGSCYRACSQVAVWWESLLPGDSARTRPAPPLAANVPSAVTHVTTWVVDLSLCVDLAPDVIEAADQITAQGVLGARYAWALWRGLTARWVAGTLFAPAETTGRARHGTLAGIPSPAMDGGLVAMTARFSYNLVDAP